MNRATRFALVGVAAVAVVGGLLVVGAVGTGGAGSALPTTHFVSEAAAAGVVHTFTGDDYVVGGGVATFDCDANGRPDLYIAGGTSPAALYVNDSPVGGSLAFHQLPGPTTDLEKVMGAYPIDIDGDGLTDLVVLRDGETVLLRGLGDCRFERANETWGFDGGDLWTTSFSATWEDRATLPTLAFGRYVDAASTDSTYRCLPNELVRPAETGGGYGASVPLTPSWCALSMLFSDWDRTGHADLRVSNDRHYYPDSSGSEQLWRMTPGVPPQLYTSADGWQTLAIWGMGIASQDLTGDGKPEVFLTSQGDNKLQTLVPQASGPDYADMALRLGVTAHRPFTGPDTHLPSTAWHPEFADVNDDGFMDLFISKGNVGRQPDYAMQDPSNLLIGQADGTFVEHADDAGILTFARGRGAAVVDLDLDGLPDVVEVNRGDPVNIWRNVGAGDASASKPMGHWLGVRLDMPGPNRDGIGAWIEVKAGNVSISKELTIGGGHASGDLGWTHLGLGSADRAEVRVLWPDGGSGPWQAIDANQFVVLSRGGKITPWTPGQP